MTFKTKSLKKKKEQIMDIIKKLFTFNNDETSAIGLCKFNDNFYKNIEAKKAAQKKFKHSASLSQMLKRSY